MANRAPFTVHREVAGLVLILVQGRLNGVGPWFAAECRQDQLDLDAEGLITRAFVAGALGRPLS